MRGLQWNVIPFPLAAGLNQRSDDRARQPPYLDICRDVQFDELGGLQTRYPYASIGDPFGVEARRLVANGPELLCFTKDTLKSYDAESDAWVTKGTHLATKITETPKFVTTGDQINPDRAELENTILYAWEDTARVYVAAVDKTTGAVTMSATAIAGPASRPRLVALDTRILLFFTDNLSALFVYAIDPANPAASLAGASTTVLGGGAFNAYYDATRVIGADAAVVACRRAVTTSYTVATVTATPTVTATTKARTCDGPIAISCSPTGTQIQIARGNGSSVQGDLLTLSTHADVFTAQAIGTALGTPINQIAAAHRSVQDGGQYRCYVTWSAQEVTTSTAFQSKSNWVDTGGALGAQAVFVLRLGVASRSFEHDGRIYTWMVFAAESGASGMGEPLGMRAQLQNTYFLYRDDAFLAAKAAFDVAGGHAASTGRLPGVALVDSVFRLGDAGWPERTYAWCGTERRLIPLGGGGARKRSGYADRGPRDILITFDSNEARRVARLGNTLYVAGGGEVLQYDGEGLTEVGFHIYPWVFGGVMVGGGSLPAGAYSYKSTQRWQNAAGESERSTTATGEQLTSSGAQTAVFGTTANLHVTHKKAPRSNVAIEIWRTEVNPSPEDPFYLITDVDPANTTGDNCYIANDPTTGFHGGLDDNLTDDDLKERQTNPENGNVLENLAPPAATIIVASAERLFLAGIPGDPNRIWYSKLRADGEVAAFHDVLTVQLPSDGGAITALAFMNETLVVFKERAIYELPGDGFTNGSEGQNYGPARVIATDVGAVGHEAVAMTPNGLVFKSAKGWFSLDRGRNAQYIGGPITDYDVEPVVAVHALEGKHEIRVLTNVRMLVFDLIAQQWGERTLETNNETCVTATVWNGTHLYMDLETAFVEQTTLADLADGLYGLDVETGWIKLADLLGGGRIRQLQVLGEYRSAHRLRIRIAYDYKVAYVDDRYWTPSPTVVGDELNVRVGPSRQQCRAIKIRLTAEHAVDDDLPPTGEALKLTGLAFEVGLRTGLNKRLAVAQKAGG